MDERERNPVREEAAVRAHAWCVRLWNERKISAEFTIADEAGLIEMMIGLLTMFPPPVAADFTLNAESNLAPETQAALGDEVARAVYLHRLESELYGMRTQLGDSRDLRAQLESDNTELRRQLAEAQAELARLRGEVGDVTDEQLQAIAALCDAATPGPWERSSSGFTVRHAGDSVATMGAKEDAQAKADAAFIANARQAVPELLAFVADLRRQLAQAWEEFEVLGIAAGAENPSSPESILTAILHMTPGRPAKGATHDN